jgi:hypothetical protein
LPDYLSAAQKDGVSPLWIEPVVRTLHEWPDRMQEFKTHVFPHCFLPDVDEYLRFLSYLRFGTHLQSNDALPIALRTFEGHDNGLSESEEFRALLAAIEAGKELNMVRDNGEFSYSRCYGGN